MSKLQPAGAGLEQERREHEEVLAADKSDLDVRAASAESLEVSRGQDTTEPTTDDDETHVSPCSRCCYDYECR
jgi:hypothetical protein